MAIAKTKPATPELALTAMHRTIAKLAHKYSKYSKNDYADLYQFGCIGLMEAYEKFDENAGASFSTYAYQWIWANIRSISTNHYYKHSANTNSFKTLDDVAETASYEIDNDSSIDFQSKLDNMDNTTRAITRARMEGWTFAEIADAMTKLGKPMTLHQCYNRYKRAMED